MRFALVLAALLGAAAPALAQADAAPLGTVRGVVTDAETGQPIVGAGVMIAALEVGAVSGRDGTFEIAGVPPGTHAVRAGAFRYHAAIVEAAVFGPEATVVEVALRPGASAGCVDHDHGQGGGDE